MGPLGGEMGEPEHHLPAARTKGPRRVIGEADAHGGRACVETWERGRVSDARPREGGGTPRRQEGGVRCVGVMRVWPDLASRLAGERGGIGRDASVVWVEYSGWAEG